MLLVLVALPFRLLWLLCKSFLKLLGLTGKFLGLAGKSAVIVGKKGAVLFKDAAIKAAEFEKENKVLHGTATRLMDGAKKGASVLADSLGIEQEWPVRT